MFKGEEKNNALTKFPIASCSVDHQSKWSTGDRVHGQVASSVQFMKPNVPRTHAQSIASVASLILYFLVGSDSRR